MYGFRLPFVLRQVHLHVHVGAGEHQAESPAHRGQPEPQRRRPGLERRQARLSRPLRVGVQRAAASRQVPLRAVQGRLGRRRAERERRAVAAHTRRDGAALRAAGHALGHHKGRERRDIQDDRGHRALAARLLRRQEQRRVRPLPRPQSDQPVERRAQQDQTPRGRGLLRGEGASVHHELQSDRSPRGTPRPHEQSALVHHCRCCCCCCHRTSDAVASRRRATQREQQQQQQ